jgi:hypothetical protein
MPTQRVEKRCALAGELLARPMAHQLGLIVDRTHRNEALARPHRRLADRRRIGRIVLVAPDKRLHMRRRDQLHFETERQQLPRPMMGRRTGLHRHVARRKLGEELR